MSREAGREVRALEVTVRGRVQRVGYRRYLLDLAQELGVTGFAENMMDGGVRIFCQAPLQVLEELLEKARNPPPPTIIKQLDVREARPRPKLKYSRIRYGPIQEELQEGFGAMQSLFMSYWEEFRKFRNESLEVSHEILNEVRELRKDLKTILDERLARMEKEIAEIKAKLGLL